MVNWTKVDFNPVLGTKIVFPGGQNWQSALPAAAPYPWNTCSVAEDDDFFVRINGTENSASNTCSIAEDLDWMGGISTCDIAEGTTAIWEEVNFSPVQGQKVNFPAAENWNKVI